jgi:hypothetical protein
VQPSVLAVVGMVPGILLLLTVACMSAWSNYVVGIFKLNHPEVYSIAE